MKKELEQIKNQFEKHAVVDFVSINMGGLRNSWSYSDTDAMTDYYRGSGGSEKDLIEVLKKEGADIIQITTNDNQIEGDPKSEKLLKKIDRIAKRSGYINKVKGHNAHWEMDGVRVESYVINGTFVREEGI